MISCGQIHPPKTDLIELVEQDGLRRRAGHRLEDDVVEHGDVLVDEFLHLGEPVQTSSTAALPDTRDRTKQSPSDPEQFTPVEWAEQGRHAVQPITLGLGTMSFYKLQNIAFLTEAGCSLPTTRAPTSMRALKTALSMGSSACSSAPTASTAIASSSASPLILLSDSLTRYAVNDVGMLVPSSQ